MRNYYVIYPCGDRTRLAVESVLERELEDWDIAYKDSFPDTPEGKREAEAKAADLAHRHGLAFRSETAYLE